jgi:rhamnogalacturonyl hydrolase YesR
MMYFTLKYQAEDGMWRQLIDDPQSWPKHLQQACLRLR